MTAETKEPGAAATAPRLRSKASRLNPLQADPIGARAMSAGATWEIRIGQCVLGYTRPTAKKRRSFLLARKRLRELMDLMTLRYGGPCRTKRAHDYLTFAVAHLVHVASNPDTYCLIWARDWTPDIDLHDVRKVVATVEFRPRYWSADQAAFYLRVTADERDGLLITTIGCVGSSKADRKLRRKMREVERRREQRRKQGAKPRAQYEAESIAAEAARTGVSVSTIKRRRAARRRGGEPCLTDTISPKGIGEGHTWLTPSGNGSISPLMARVLRSTAAALRGQPRHPPIEPNPSPSPAVVALRRMMAQRLREVVREEDAA